MAAQRELTGVVLAGGKSRRLGRDKVCEPLSGRSFLAHTAELLLELCPEVYVSGRDAGPLAAELGAKPPWLPDDVPGCGPMGGILTCLQRLQRPLLVLACDLPLMDADTLRTLVAAWRNRPPHAVMTTFQQVETGYIESLAAVYEPEAAPLLQEAVDQSMFKLSRAVPAEKRCHISYSQDQALPFFNINYPADLALLRRLRPERLAGLAPHDAANAVNDQRK